MWVRSRLSKISSRSAKNLYSEGADTPALAVIARVVAASTPPASISSEVAARMRATVSRLRACTGWRRCWIVFVTGGSSQPCSMGLDKRGHEEYNTTHVTV